MTIRFQGDEAQARLLARKPGLPDPKTKDVFPGKTATVMRRDETAALAVEEMLWGFPPFKGTRPVCHVANITSVYWRPWLRPAWRCVVPVRAFSEFSSVDHKAHWFTASDGSALWFAGIWRPMSGRRSSPPPAADEDPRGFALVNAPANRLIAEHHPASMPTILRQTEITTWLSAPKEIAFELRRPFRADLLRTLH